MTAEKRNRAYKYRIYPDAEQCELLSKTFGCCRKVWNLMLAEKQEYYNRTGKMIQTTPAKYKNEFPFLKEVDSLALCNEQLALQSAYKAFFEKRSGFPKYKSRHKSRRSYTTNCVNGNICVGIGSIKIPKTGRIKARIHRTAPDTWVLKSATVSQSSDGKYYCSVLYEYTAEIPDVATGDSVGLDYKSDGLYVSSDGDVCGSPKYYRKAQKKLAREQRKLSHMKGSLKGEEKSQNYIKQQMKVNRTHCHVANQRKDFLHKQSSAIAKRYDIVCVEDLNLKSLANKGFGNGKATMDNGYGMFLNMLSYKLSDKGGMLIRIDKWYPSSQTCSCCGTVNPAIKDLTIRTWICPACGALHDRDRNAAVNILREGLASLSA